MSGQPSQVIIEKGAGMPEQASLSDIIETARQGARNQLKNIALSVQEAEAKLDEMKRWRSATVKEAVKVLDTAEVASLLGVSTGTVSNWIRDPDAPKRTRKDEDAAEDDTEDDLPGGEDPFAAMDE